jgi:putative endonuclease
MLYLSNRYINFERRFYEHNIGHSKFTKLGMPWEKKFTLEFDTLPEAKQYEAKIKKMKSRIYIEKLINDVS